MGGRARRRRRKWKGRMEEAEELVVWLADQGAVIRWGWDQM